MRLENAKWLRYIREIEKDKSDLIAYAQKLESQSSYSNNQYENYYNLRDSKSSGLPEHDVENDYRNERESYHSKYYSHK